MGSNSRQSPEGSLYFLQTYSENLGDLQTPITNALRAFCNLFGINLKPQTLSQSVASGTHLFDLASLLFMMSTTKQPILALGTLSSRDAIKRSWDELGLNLFDIPWFNPVKAFRYTPLLSLVGSLSDLRDVLLPIDLSNVAIGEQSIPQLQWARCHQFAGSVQNVVGHGNRDRFQTVSWDEIRASLYSVVSKAEFSDLPCRDHCRLKQRIDELLSASDNNDDQPRLVLAQKIAALDCRVYRLAPVGYFAVAPKPEELRFQRIIILENDPEFRRCLKEALGEFLEDGGKIEIANPRKSWEFFRLCNESGADILRRYHDDEHLAPGQILACFDLDLGQENIPDSRMHDFIGAIFGGHWIMYGTAREHPGVPRLIISGYRSQDLFGYAAGGRAYVLKPFTRTSLETQIRNAAVLHRVKWLCPPTIQNDYASLFDGKVTFEYYVSLLSHWLSNRRIELEIIGEATEENIGDSDLIVLDIFRTNSERPVLNLLEIISKIRYANGHASLLLVVPSDIDIGNAVDYYRKLPLALREGSDAIIKKPMWLVADGHATAKAALGNIIVEQLALLDVFDTKYQILIPVAAVLRRKEQDPKEPADSLYARLLPYLIDTYGLAGRLKDIAKVGPTLITELEKKIAAGPAQDHDLYDVLLRFSKTKAIKDKEIQRHLSLEAWLRDIVDRRAKETFPAGDGFPQSDVHTLTEPLARVFGGATRYEFSVRGSWYKATEPVDDMLIVIEFCAKSSIVARMFVEETVVKYLREIAGEDCVLVQEIPLRGFLR